MSILSFEFLVFVATVIALFYLLPKKARWVVLLAASTCFYLMSGWKGGMYLLAVSTLTWFAAIRIGKLRVQMDEAAADDNPALAHALKRLMRVWLIHCLLLVLGALVFIKYAEMMRLAINALLRALENRTQFEVFNVLVPLGLSYFTFQSVGYVVDVYWGKTKAQPNFFKHLLFVSFFPQMIQGPISTQNQLAPQLLNPPAFHPRRMTMGFQLMLWGYFKKLVLADRLAGVTNAVAAGTEQPGWLVFLGLALYVIRLYGDFSGGMDVVRGVALMLGIDLTENFRRPFFSVSVAEYWRRWHITLGAWFRTYVLYPLSTSRFGSWLSGVGKRMLGKKAGRMLPGAVSTFLIFLLIGMWHTANWNALIFGAYFGLLMGGAMLLEPLFKTVRKKLHVTDKIWWWRLFGWMRTMALILLAQVFAFTASPVKAWPLLTGLFSGWNFAKLAETLTGFMTWLEWGVAGGALLIVLLVDVLCECKINVNERLAKGSFLLRWPVLLALILVILLFGCYGEGFDSAAFLYTNF